MRNRMPSYKYRFVGQPGTEVTYQMKMSEKEAFEKFRPWLERVIEPVAFGDLTSLRKAHE